MLRVETKYEQTIKVTINILSVILTVSWNKQQ
jgi:hypothetical protein